ncbi:MAG: Ig-like domain-containing protein [Gemmataceae bacterium]
MTHVPPARRRLAVEALESRVQPSASLAPSPAAVTAAAVAGPLPLAVVDFPLATLSPRPAPVTAAADSSAPVMLSGPEDVTYVAAFDTSGAGGGAMISAAPAMPAALVVAVDTTPPTAVDDAYTTAVRTSVRSLELVVGAPGGLLGNDLSPGGAVLVASAVTQPSSGLLLLSPDGSFVYTASVSFTGTDSFTYVVTDGTLTSAPATVVVTVAGANRAAVASPDAYVGAEDTILSAGVPGLLGNDTDPDGDTLTVLLEAGPAVGTLVLTTGGAFTYTPPPDWSGTTSFTYRVTDGSLTSLPATVTLTVVPVNDSPTAADDTFSTPQGTPLSGAGVLGNDADADGDALTAMAVAGPVNGTLVLNADGSFLYSPDPAFTGTDTFTYRASDGKSVSGVATVTLNVGRAVARPAAADDDYAVASGGTLMVPAPGVLANDTPSGIGTLTAVLNSDPSHGTLTLNPDGSFTYTPDLGYSGTDSFGYKAADGGGVTGGTRVRIVVHSANRAPLGGADTVTTVAGTPVTVSAATVLANDSDPDGDVLAAGFVVGGAHGTVTVAADGSFTYTPDAGFHGTDTFTYRVSDGQLISGLVQVTVTVSNPPAPNVPPPPAPPPSSPTGSGTPTAPVQPTPVPATPTPEPTPTGVAVPTIPAALPVSVSPAPSNSSDFVGPFGGGTAGTVSPVPAVSSGTPTGSYQPAGTPTAADTGRVYAASDGPVMPEAPSPAPQPPPATLPQPVPPSPEPPAPATVAVLPPAVPATATAPIVPSIETPPEPVIVPATLLAPLDRVREELRAEAAGRAAVDSIVVSGTVAVAGMVLLNTRAVYWFLSALLARPAVLRRFDPLDVIFTWERDAKRPRDVGPDDSLQAMVG